MCWPLRGGIKWNPSLAVPVLARLRVGETLPATDGLVLASANERLHLQFDIPFGADLVESMGVLGFDISGPAVDGLRSQKDFSLSIDIVGHSRSVALAMMRCSA